MERNKFGRLAFVGVLIVAAGCGDGSLVVDLPSLGSSPQVSSSVTTAPPEPLRLDRIVAQVDPVMVNIEATLDLAGWQSSGSGIVLTETGQVVTSYHVVRRASSIVVEDVADGLRYQATLLGYDNTHDVALLELADAKNLRAAQISNEDAHIGDEVVVTGNARGVGGAPTSVLGTVADLNREIIARNEADGSSKILSDLIELNAEVVPGQSGGAVANRHGELIGLVAAASAPLETLDPKAPTSAPGAPSSTKSPGETGHFERREEPGEPKQPRGYAVPMKVVMSIVDKIRAKQPTEDIHISPSAILGVRVTDRDESIGAYVTDVVPFSPAADAGLATGDVITRIDGQRLDSPGALRLAINQHAPGDVLRVEWTARDGSLREAKVQLIEGAE